MATIPPEDPEDAEPTEIGRRAGLLRQQRGLSLDTTAGLAGISGDTLERLETGRHWYERLGLVEDLATALGCSVTDLTGQPYLPMDQDTADALTAMPGLRDAVHSVTLNHPPELPARPLDQLTLLLHQAHEHLDQDRVGPAGHGLGTLLTELHTHATAKDTTTAQAALPVLVQACHLAARIAEQTGHPDLALALTTHGRAAAARSTHPITVALAPPGMRPRLDPRRRQADAAVALALAELDPVADPTAPDTAPAEMLGLTHLTATTLAARTHHATDAHHHHLTKAHALAELKGCRSSG